MNLKTYGNINAVGSYLIGVAAGIACVLGREWPWWFIVACAGFVWGAGLAIMERKVEL